eukprot:13116659-Alexandrium_andersonii.AAC.1
MRHYGFRPKNGEPMPANVTNKFTQEREQRSKHSRRNGGMGLACDTSGWFNLKDYLRAFSTWHSVRNNRPLGTGD